MNYYERIQQSIDYMEHNIENNITVESIAKEAYMSLSNFYRLFFAMTGYQAKEYLINRRISQAAVMLKNPRHKVIDIALSYSYNSVDAFSRIFKKITGHTPSSYAKGNYNYVFERIDLMERFENEDKQTMDEYPDIKVINNLPSMRVAYYCYYGEQPEDGAFKVMREWVIKNKLDINNGNYRIFGYNSPDSDPDAKEYGYEVCVTIPDDMNIDDPFVKAKVLQGGLYAVTSIDPKENLGEAIMKGWKRFSKWVDGSKYQYGTAQYLEEHLGFSKDFEHLGGVDLYMPICLKEASSDDFVEEIIKPFTVATYTATGKNAEKKARDYLFQWIEDNNISLGSKTRIFSFYNFEQSGKPDFFYKVFVQIPAQMEITDTNIVKEEFIGGRFLSKKVKYMNNAKSWFSFIKYMSESDTYSFGAQPFMEEYLIEKPFINIDTDVIQHMPIR